MDGDALYWVQIPDDDAGNPDIWRSPLAGGNSQRLAIIPVGSDGFFLRQLVPLGDRLMVIDDSARDSWSVAKDGAGGDPVHLPKWDSGG